MSSGGTRVSISVDVADVVDGRRVDHRRLLADLGDLVLAGVLATTLGIRTAGGLAVLSTSAIRRHSPGWSKRQVGDVDGLGRVGVAGGRLRGERGLGLEALDAGRERALGLAGRPVGGVDGDVGVGDLARGRR